MTRHRAVDALVGDTIVGSSTPCDCYHSFGMEEECGSFYHGEDANGAASKGVLRGVTCSTPLDAAADAQVADAPLRGRGKDSRAASVSVSALACAAAALAAAVVAVQQPPNGWGGAWTCSGRRREQCVWPQNPGGTRVAHVTDKCQ